MLKEGMEIYYCADVNQKLGTADANVYSGKVTEMKENGNDYTFEIDSFGSCEGRYRISSGMIGKSVFLSKEEAESAIKKGKK